MLCATASRSAGDELVGRRPGRALEQPVAHPRPGDGSEAQHGLGGRAQRLDAQHERVGDVGGQALAGVAPAAASSSVKNGLPSARAKSSSTRRASGRRAEDPGELRDDLLAGEALQRDALDDRRALGLGHQRPQRVAAVQLVGAVGGDEQHALMARVAHEEGQEVARGAVGPVDVLEDEHERLRVGQAVPGGASRSSNTRPCDERAARRRPRRRRAGAAAAPGRPRRAAELAGVEAAQRADDRRVGQLAVAEVDAVAGEHARALAPARGSASSATRRVLPTPDSPATSATAGRPSAARSSAADRPASSRSRPTNSGLVTRCVKLNRPPSHRRESTTTRVPPRCAVAASSACPPRARTSARGSTRSRARWRCTWSSRCEETGRFAVHTDLKIARDRRNLAVRGFARLRRPRRLHASASGRRSRSAAGWARAPPPTSRA